MNQIGAPSEDIKINFKMMEYYMLAHAASMRFLYVGARRAHYSSHRQNALFGQHFYFTHAPLKAAKVHI